MVLSFYAGSWRPWAYGLWVLLRRGPPVRMKVHQVELAKCIHALDERSLIARFAPAPSPHLALQSTPPQSPHCKSLCILLVGGGTHMCSCYGTPLTMVLRWPSVRERYMLGHPSLSHTKVHRPSYHLNQWAGWVSLPPHPRKRAVFGGGVPILWPAWMLSPPQWFSKALSEGMPYCLGAFSMHLPMPLCRRVLR